MCRVFPQCYTTHKRRAAVCFCLVLKHRATRCVRAPDIAPALFARTQLKDDCGSSPSLSTRPAVAAGAHATALEGAASVASSLSTGLDAHSSAHHRLQFADINNRFYDTTAAAAAASTAAVGSSVSVVNCPLTMSSLVRAPLPLYPALVPPISL